MKREEVELIVGEIADSIMDNLKKEGVRPRDVYPTLVQGFEQSWEQIGAAGELIRKEWSGGDRSNLETVEFLINATARAAALAQLMLACLPKPEKMIVVEVDADPDADKVIR